MGKIHLSKIYLHKSGMLKKTNLQRLKTMLNSLSLVDQPKKKKHVKISI